MSTSLFRLIGGVCRTMVVSGTGGSISLFMIFLLGGYVVPKGLYLTNSLFLLIGCYRLMVPFAPQSINNPNMLKLPASYVVFLSYR